MDRKYEVIDRKVTVRDKVVTHELIEKVVYTPQSNENEHRETLAKDVIDTITMPKKTSIVKKKKRPKRPLSMIDLGLGLYEKDLPYG